MKLPQKKINGDYPMITQKSRLTRGERAADKLTQFLGSWTFILSFISFLLLWIIINAVAWKLQWDPYPFILLNLTLSCVAALQAPIIMMSQNRQNQSDRIAAKYDYAVNRRTQREVADMQKDLDEIKDMIRNISTQKTKK